MSPHMPRLCDQKPLKRKRQTRRKRRLTKKQPKANTLENRKVQKTVQNPKNTKSCKKYKMLHYMIFPDKIRSDFLFIVVSD